MMKNLTKSILLLSTFITFNCGSGGNKMEVESLVNIYDNCCNTVPVEMDFNPGKVYIANIFTPNNDGQNDIFYIQTDEDIEMIEEFRITDDEGNILTEMFSIFPNTPIYGWYPYENSNTTHQGLFNYYVKVRNVNGSTFELSGNICSFICDESNIFDSFENCGFMTQHSGTGKFDPFLPTNEEDCF